MPILTTIDTNCIVDLEEIGPRSNEVRAVLSAHGSKLTVRIPGISASEKTQTGGSLPNFSLFEERLKGLGLGHLEILKPMAYWDVGFWDQAVFPTAAMRALEKKIHAVLFPNMALNWSDYAKAAKIDVNGALDWKWRNAKCDVQALWCHIRYGGKWFITSDRNFLKATKSKTLQALGAGAIMTPAQAVKALKGAT